MSARQLKRVMRKVVRQSDNPNLVAWLQGDEGRGEGVSALALPATPRWRGKVAAHVQQPQDVTFRVSACDQRSLFRLLPRAARLVGAKGERLLLPNADATWR